MRLIFIGLMMFGPAAAAVGYSVNVGFNDVGAQTSRGHVDSKFNGRFGLGIDLALSDRLTLVTGTDYVFRRVTWHRDDGARLAVDFDYIDVPAHVRARIGGGVSAFGGLRFGINVSDKVEVQTGVAPFDARARAIITLIEVGLRVDLPRAFALEGFAEREIGDGFAASLSDAAAAGGRVTYSF